MPKVESINKKDVSVTSGKQGDDSNTDCNKPNDTSFKNKKEPEFIPPLEMLNSGELDCDEYEEQNTQRPISLKSPLK